MIPEELELAKEGVKESVKQMFAPVQDIVRQLTGPATTEVGLMWGDFFRAKRLRNAFRLFADVKQAAYEGGFELKPVAPRLFLPILESASLQDDEDLHKRWVALLTNAARIDFDTEILPCFPDILKQLTSAEAQFLDRAYDDATADEENRSTPQTAAFYGLLGPNRIGAEILMSAHPLVIENLERLMLVSRNSGVRFSTNERQFENTFAAANHLYITNIGKAFVRSCRIPKHVAV